MHDDRPFVAALSEGFIAGATGADPQPKKPLPSIELRRTFQLGYRDGAKSHNVYSPDMDEHCHQVLVVRWAALLKQLRSGLKMLTAIPNAGKRTQRAGARLKAEGMRPGYPDLVLNVPVGRFGGLFIELKTPKGKPSAAQLEWIADLEDAGNKAVICYGWLEAIRVLLEYVEWPDKPLEN